MNNFWFGDSSIQEQEIAYLCDSESREIGVSLLINNVEVCLTMREMKQCIKDLEDWAE